MHSSLPPSGPSAGLYSRGPAGPLVDHGPAGPPPVPSAVNDPRSSPTGGGGNGGGGVVDYDGAPGPQSASSDPLGTMDSLRQTLPDVGGAPTPVGTTDN
jgi:hypothetical protein